MINSKVNKYLLTMYGPELTRSAMSKYGRRLSDEEPDPVLEKPPDVSLLPEEKT